MHVARRFPAFSFDQLVYMDVVETAASGDSSMWWTTLANLCKNAPYRTRPPSCGRVGVRYPGSSWREMGLLSPSDRLGLGERFGVTAEAEGSSLHWVRIAPVRARAPYLPYNLSLAEPPRGVERVRLPTVRGVHSRTWQRILEEDLHARGALTPTTRHRRPTMAVAHGAAMAHGAAADGAATAGAVDEADDASWDWTNEERLALLPAWVISHWGAAQLGLVGRRVPRTLIFHATNAADKELALKANGYWLYEASHAHNATQGSPRNLESRIWAGGERPPVVSYRLGGSARSFDNVSTHHAYVHEVVQPLLLAALATGRVAVLPWLPCTLKWLRSPAGMPAGSSFGRCPTGACSFRAIATGSTSPVEQQRQEQQLSSERGARAVPFPQADRIGRGPLRCTPLEANAAQLPLGDRRCQSGQAASLLHWPLWETYRRRLGADTTAADVALTASLKADGEPLELDYREFVRLVKAAEGRAASPQILYLPARQLRLGGVPPEVQRQYRDFCTSRHAESAPLAPHAPTAAPPAHGAAEAPYGLLR